MAVSAGLAGRAFPPTDPYLVSDAKIREFADAIGSPGTETPVTFPIIVAFRAMLRLMVEPEVGIDLHNVVHRDQRFVSARAVRAGDELTATLTVESLRHAAGTDLIGTRTEIRDAAGKLVSTAYATLAHRATGVPA